MKVRIKMGGSSKQTVGYKFYAGLQVAIGNCIEYMININPDNRGWIFTKSDEIAQLKTGDTSIAVNKPNIFGGDKQEGGWVGTIDIHTGRPENLRQNEYLAEQDSPLISAYPYLSYLVFRGAGVPNLEIGWDLSNFGMQSGFQLVSMSGMLKEVLYWPKRTRIKDDGSEQWYKIRPSDNAIVCEIDAYRHLSDDQIVGEFSAEWEVKASDNFYPQEITNHTKTLSDPSTGVGESIILSPFSPFFSESYAASSFHYYDDINFGDGTFSKVEYKLTANSGSAVLEFDCECDMTGAEFIFSYSGGYVYVSDFIQVQVLNVEFNRILYRLHIIVKIEQGEDFLFTIGAKGYLKPTDATQAFNNQTTINLKASRISYQENGEFGAMDINPIHKIREIITDDTAMNKPEAMINDANFMAAADRIWDEGLGVSGAFTEKSCKEAIDELLYHIEAGIRLNRQTGLYEIILFRDDLLDLDNAQLFDVGNIKSFTIETANIDDVINSVNVNYYDRENIKDSSFSLDELGSILSNQPNAETLDFPYFMNRRNAELVGNWKLKQLSTPTRKGSFTTGKYDARKINRYDVVKLTWHNQNMIEVPIRIMKIGLGDGRDNTVTLDWVEVIPYSSIAFPTINVDPPTSVILPPQPNQSIAFEMPYFEAVQRFGQTQVDTELANNPDLGYLMVATKKPQNNSINALLFTDDGTGYQQASIIDYCPVVQLDQNISYLDTTFAVKNVSAISQAEIGTLILCEEELMVYQSYDTETRILTVKRAALDTHPKPHSQDAVFYFYDAFNAFDSEQYVLSEVIDAKVLTTTPSGILDLEAATVLPVEMNARPIRPYPPANIKINDTYFIESIVVSNDVVVTWVDRNRVQQTGGSILGWTDETVSKEIGVTYSIELSSEDVVLASDSNIDANTYTFASTLLIPNKPHKLKLWSVREGYESYQIFEHNFFGEAISLILTATVYENEVVGSTVPDANITVEVDDSLTANMKFDGSSISGTAEAGATITIEIEE